MPDFSISSSFSCIYSTGIRGNGRTYKLSFAFQIRRDNIADGFTRISTLPLTFSCTIHFLNDTFLGDKNKFCIFLRTFFNSSIRFAFDPDGYIRVPDGHIRVPDGYILVLDRHSRVPDESATVNDGARLFWRKWIIKNSRPWPIWGGCRWPCIEGS
jgi:hypothetical protein